ncbi:MAG: hypothetical protein HOI33_08815 [Rhodospirillaceae bacterium]|nr:hypothetical protein [Rhodospirillaceae bacterium]
MTLRRLMAILFIAAGVFFPFWGGVVQAAEKVNMRAWDHTSYGRIIFEWPSKAGYEITLKDNLLKVHFDKAMTGDLAPLLNRLSSYVSSAIIEGEGHDVVFVLKRPHVYRSFADKNAIIIDLSPKKESALVKLEDTEKPSSPKIEAVAPPEQDVRVEPVAPQSTKTPPKKSIPKQSVPEKSSVKKAPQKAPQKLSVRIGEHPGYVRFVFDWPSKVNYELSQDKTKATLSFDRPATINLSKIKKSLPNFVKGVDVTAGKKDLQVKFSLPKDARLRHFNSGTKVVLDVFKTANKQATAPVPKIIKKGTKRARVVPSKKKKANNRPTSLTASRKAKAPTDAKPPKAAPVEKVESEKAEKLLPEETASKTPASGKEAEGEAQHPVWLSGRQSPKTIEPVIANNVFSLRFKWPEGVAAAAYRRSGFLWLVFDHLEVLDLAGIPEHSAERIFGIEQIPDARATILRLTTAYGLNPTLRREGLIWFFDFEPHSLSATVPISIRAQVDTPTDSSLFLPVPDSGQKLIVRDAVVGDSLILVPVPSLGEGINGTREYAQFRLLGTAQGVVIEPYSDTLETRVDKDGIEISSSVGLYISSRPEGLDDSVLMTASEESYEGYEPILDMSGWGKGVSPWFSEARQDIQGKIAEAPVIERPALRLRLAEYYFANGFYLEAAGLLSGIKDEAPDFINNPDFKLFKSIAEFMAGRFLEAEESLGAPVLAINPEGILWRGALAAHNKDWEKAAHGFSTTADLIKNYPRQIQIKLGLLAAETAYYSSDLESAKSFLQFVRENRPSAAQENYASYLLGKVFMESGASENSITLWDKVIAGSNRESRAKARFAKIDYLVKQGELSEKKAADQLEAMRFSWRGDEFEFDLLEQLSDIYIRNENYQKGLQTMKEAATSFPKHERARLMAKKMGDAFAHLFLEGGADKLSPIKALSIFREFRELTPAGEVGDKMVQNLSQRMVAIDLLDQAAGLLSQQIEFRLKGVDKARVGMQLALINLLNRKPQEAIKALRATEEKDLPGDLTTDRLHLEARALFDLDRNKEALVLISGDESLVAEQLRADIYWADHQWASASRSMASIVEKIEAQPSAPAVIAMPEEVTAIPVADETAALPVDGEEAEAVVAEKTENVKSAKAALAIASPSDKVSPEMILRWAIALALSDNSAGLYYLKDRYASDMKDTPLWDDFWIVVTQPTGSVDSLTAITQRLKEVGQYEAFIANYQQRLQNSGMSLVN